MDTVAVSSFLATLLYSTFVTIGVAVQIFLLLNKHFPNLSLWISLPVFVCHWPIPFLLMTPDLQDRVSATFDFLAGLKLVIVEYTVSTVFTLVFTKSGGVADWIAMGYICAHMSTIALYGPANACRSSGATWGVSSGATCVMKIITSGGIQLEAIGFALLSVYCLALIKVDAPFYMHYDLGDAVSGKMLTVGYKRPTKNDPKMRRSLRKMQMARKMLDKVAAQSALRRRDMKFLRSRSVPDLGEAIRFSHMFDD